MTNRRRHTVVYVYACAVLTSVVQARYGLLVLTAHAWLRYFDPAVRGARSPPSKSNGCVPPDAQRTAKSAKSGSTGQSAIGIVVRPSVESSKKFTLSFSRRTGFAFYLKESTRTLTIGGFDC